jgi:hypothetical protein
LEAGKRQLNGDTKREATSHDVAQLRQENEQLKQLVAELSLIRRAPVTIAKLDWEPSLTLKL